MYSTKKKKKNFKYKAKKLMVVAHPDDETIFGGAQLIKEPKTWKVLVITNGLGGGEDNKQRQKNLDKAMSITETNYEIWDHIDRYNHGLNSKMKKDFEKEVVRGKYTAIVSHNSTGEYGHPQHQDVSEMSKKVANKHGILFGVFGHGKKLNRAIIKKKKEMFKCYKGVSDAFTKEVEGEDGKTVNWFEHEKIDWERSTDIPHLIHQIWIGGKMPTHKKDFLKHNRKMVKKDGWTLRLWGNKDLKEENFPRTWKWIQKSKKDSKKRENPNGVWAQISDLMRLEIVYNYGGYYMDTNMEIIQSLENILPPPGKTMVVANQEPCGLKCKAGGEFYLSNGFFGATKGNYMLKRATAAKNLNEIDFTNKHINMETGPYYFRKFITPKSTYVISSYLIYPFYPTYWDSEYIKDKDKSDNKCIFKSKKEAEKLNPKKIIEIENRWFGKLFITHPCKQYPNSYLMNHTIGGSWAWS